MDPASIAPTVFEPAARSDRLLLRRGFWIGIGAGIAVLLATARPEYLESALGGVAILACALLPAGLWVHHHAKGLPLFPAFTLSYAWAFGLPLLYEHPVVSAYSADQQLVAALTVCGFLLLGTAVWFAITRRPAHVPISCIQLKSSGADLLFLLLLGAGTIGGIIQSVIWSQLPPGLGSIITAIILATNALACFVLSYEYGRGRLSGASAVAFVGLLVAAILVSLTSLLLVSGMSLLAISVFGFTIGARRFPWLLALVAVGGFAFLHVGKGEMREKYWGEGSDTDRSPPKLSEYPDLLIDWLSMSTAKLNSDISSEEEEGQSLLERASLMQLLLYEQSVSPSELPFLDGDTYKVIPTLLVPRIFMPNKPASHEGTYILNIYYGFQSREDTQTTTIGFGLLNEAFANFGYWGVGGLAILLGLFYGGVGRWAGSTPIFSLRTLFAVIVASYSFQTEYAAGVYVAALFQSTVALLLLAAVLMRSAPVEKASIPALD